MKETLKVVLEILERESFKNLKAMIRLVEEDYDEDDLRELYEDAFIDKDHAIEFLMSHDPIEDIFDIVFTSTGRFWI